MATPREQALTDLRQSIDTLPERTRLAMLSGLGNNTVITGAFSDGKGGACPMLAAHREGVRGRCMSFPEAWDRFTGVHGRYITRQATQDEVRHLRIQLEESLAVGRISADTNGFAEAIAEHKATAAANRRRGRTMSGGFEVDLSSAVEEHRRAKRGRISGGFAVDLAAAVEEHRSNARERRQREATETGLDWLFEETLVLPEDFGREPAHEPEVEAESFDFSAEPVVLPARRERRSVLK